MRICSRQHFFKPSLITSALLTYLLTYSPFTLAETSEKATALDEISVQAEQDELNVREKKVGETIKSAQQLKRQQVQDSRDLVRYETGVTVVEKGRFGASGYAIRGVDENRVAITVDGLQQAEALSSEGFKELFEGYGNFNNNRNGVEIETLKQVQIHKGANSLKTGSGALGGSVVFETKDARDFLLDKDWYMGYKKSYNSADQQNADNFTLAGRYKWFDALFIHTKRDGQEIKNFDYKTFDASVQGRTREKTDPYNNDAESTLVKFAFQPNDEHRFTLMSDIYETQSKGADLSYTLNSTRLTDFGDSRKELEYRHNNDQVKRTNYAFSYENFSSNPFWDTAKVTYSEQKVSLRAKNEDYCDGNDECDSTANPLGLKYNENNQLVDKDGNPASYNYEEKTEWLYEFVTDEVFAKWKKEGRAPEEIINKYKEKGVRERDLPSTLFSCYKDSSSDSPDKCKITIMANFIKETLNANGTLYDLTLEENSNLISKKQTFNQLIFSCDGINCDKEEKEIDVITSRGKPAKLGFTVDKERNLAILNTSGSSTLTAHRLILPPSGSKGYNSNLWTDRFLNTYTKQLNLDFTKYIEFAQQQHNLSYGGVLSKTKKEMVNRSGVSSMNVKWWAIYPDDCAVSSSSLCNKSNVFSFLIPVNATNSALYFADDFKFNDYVSFDLGYRYDRIKYKPHYIAGVTPKIPDDMVEGMAKNFVAPFKEKDVPTERSYPSFSDKDENGVDKYADFTALTKAREEWNKENELRKQLQEENKQIANKNKLARHQANVDAFAQPTKFSAHSYALGVNLDPTDYLRLQLKYAKGFRAPTSDEVYFTFKHPDFTITPNLNLQKETAKTTQAALTLYKDFGFVTLSYFETKYRDFIDLAYQGERTIQTGTSGGSISYPVHQNINRESAKVNGFEIDSRLNFSVLHKNLSEFTLTYKMTYQKGKMKVKEALDDAGSETIDVMAPINAIQPLTNVLGLSYNHKSGKFGLDLYVTHTKAKKAKDTYNELWRVRKRNEQTTDPNNIGGKNVTQDSSVRWRSRAYTLVDLIVYAKPIENLTVQFGVYNLTNQKYITWDAARSIKQFGTSNRIDYVSGAGINRFTSPERNFKLSAELSF